MESDQNSIKEVVTLAWSGATGLFNFGGGGEGSSTVIVNVTIDTANQKFGQIGRSGPDNVGTGTIVVTLINGTPTSGSTFDIIVCAGNVAFNVTSITAGFTYAVINSGTTHVVRLTKT